MMIDDEFHRDLAALYRDSDRFARETDAWIAEHKAAREAQERENAEAEELERRAYEIERAAASAAETVPFSEEEPEPSYDFTDTQFDTLATVIAELHREFDARLERTERRLLDAMLRLAMPGERAEETAYALKDRIAQMEGRIERQLSSIVERHLKAAAAATVLDLPANFWKRDAA
jgi:hypothetical protein